MRIEGFDHRPHVARRKALIERLGGLRALVASGLPSPRNYPANTYPFRAGSHFLYLFGCPLRGAFALFENGEVTVFAPEPEPANALWHGPEPSLGDLEKALGCPVVPVAELAARLKGEPVATLAAPDFATQLAQQELLGRPVRAAQFDDLDRPLADAMVALRLIHDAAAIAELRAAATATAAAHAAGMGATRPGLRESQVRAAMEAEITARDLTMAYGSIVTVHGEVLHNEAHGNELMTGDLLLADVGAESPGGFAGDVTRTWPVNGVYSTTQKALYDVVLAAQRAAIAAVKPGVNYKDLHLLAHHEIGAGLVALGILRGEVAMLVEEGAVSLFFPHGVGHLLGLDVHDMEDLGDRAGYSPGRQRAKSFRLKSLRLDRVLAPGMAVTIEPGFYQVPAILQHPELGQDPKIHALVNWQRLAEFADVRGIRIEDDVLVTASGHEVLTAAIPKDVAGVQDAMGGPTKVS